LSYGLEAAADFIKQQQQQQDRGASTSSPSGVPSQRQ